MGNVERLAQHPSGRAVRPVFHQQAEHAQAGVLGKSVKCGSGLFIVHISRIMDSLPFVKSVCCSLGHVIILTVRTLDSRAGFLHKEDL